MAQRRWLAGLLAGLPLGLVVLGILWMWYLIRNPEDSGRRRAPQASYVNPKPVRAADLERVVQALAGEIGPRSRETPEGLRIAANYLESALGPRNIGLPVQRQSFGPEGANLVNLVAEIPGASKRDEIVLIGAAYDSAPGSPGAYRNASGVAAVVALARAMVGSRPARTVRFVFLAGSMDPVPELRGAAVYAAGCRQGEERVVAAVFLEGLGSALPAGVAPAYPPALAPFLPPEGDFVALVGGTPGAGVVNGLAAAFGEQVLLSAQRLVLDGALEQLALGSAADFAAAGFPAVAVSDLALFRGVPDGSPDDRPETVRHDVLAETVTGLQAGLSRLLNP